MADINGSQNTPIPDHPEVATGSPSGSVGPVESCASCGTPLVRRGPKGECLRCLMDFAFPSEEKGLSAPLSPDASPGGKNKWCYGHFDIVVGPDGHPVELGAGAMATTYRALDSVLHSAVALKVINQTVAEHPTVRARFLREARAAAKLHHPNVASVSHYGEQDGECYYVMELVEGETLEARVRREGPLPPVLVLDIGVQVARALAAAEACGVVHRDLKPSNIMLTTPQGERAGNAATVVKVIDWGLAKAVSTESVLGTDHTHGGFVGTPAFASPEQFSREQDRRVDHRSDIYSLGVTLWYLLCGKTPFTGTTLEEIHARQVEHPMPLAQLSGARVPARIVALLKSMMAVDPTARPQSSRELLDALRACREHFPTEGKLRPAPHGWSRWAYTLGLLVACVLAVLATRWFSHLPTTPPPPAPVGSSLAVLPLEDLSPDPANAFFVLGIRDAITSGLARIAPLKVTGAGSVKSYPAGKPRDLPAIGRALGVDHLLEGSLRRDGGRVQIKLQLTDASQPARKWTAEYDRPLAEEFTLLGEIIHTVAGRLGTPPSPVESVDIDQYPTHDPVAYDLFLQAAALPHFFQDEVQLREIDRKGIAFLEAAVARDPGYALAYGALASLHDAIVANYQGATVEELAVNHSALAESALARARSLRPDSGEIHLLYATHYYKITRDYEQARTEADLARRTMPNRADLESIGARIALKQGRGDDAIRAIEKAVALEPRNLAIRSYFEEICKCLRRYDEADRGFVEIASLLPPGAVATLPAERAFLKLEGQADLKPLRAALAALTDATDPGRDLRNGYGAVLALFEHDEKGLRYLLAASGMDVFPLANFRYPRSWYEALAARMRKDDAGARAAFGAARIEVEKTVTANPLDERNLLLLAMIDAGLGRKDDAVREAQRACSMTPLEAERLVMPSDRCCLAVVYAWTDQPELALDELEKLVSGPAGANTPDQPTYGDLKLNPLWDTLRGNPRFDAITQRLAPPG